MTRLAGGVVLMDISEELPRHTEKHYRVRTLPATTLFIHHTGAQSGRNGLAAVQGTANYHVFNKGWPRIAYHYYIARAPVHDEDGNLVVFQTLNEVFKAYHTKGCNRFGVGLVLQGHLGKADPTPFQMECLEAFLPWWMEGHDRFCKRGLGWHSISYKWGGIPKPACPGGRITPWLKEYRADLP